MRMNDGGPRARGMGLEMLDGDHQRPETQSQVSD
jgi:hypothetical protein